MAMKFASILVLIVFKLKFNLSKGTLTLCLSFIFKHYESAFRTLENRQYLHTGFELS